MSSYAKVVEYSRKVINDRRSNPGSDLITNLCAGKASDEELLGYVTLMWFAGDGHGRGLDGLLHALPGAASGASAATDRGSRSSTMRSRSFCAASASTRPHA